MDLHAALVAELAPQISPAVLMAPPPPPPAQAPAPPPQTRRIRSRARAQKPPQRASKKVSTRAARLAALGNARFTGAVKRFSPQAIQQEQKKHAREQKEQSKGRRKKSKSPTGIRAMMAG